MKQIIYYIIAILLLTVSCKKNDRNDIDASIIENTAKIKFERDAIDFKNLNNGEVVTGSFKFKNVGKYDLLISEVTTSCGCTVADYPKDPVKSGEEGLITITYDSKGYSGKRISKEITVVTNTEPSITKLHIYADVH
ncbi:MAG: DUF1573 domain-containing protein [Bacteroidales bacterium]|jgi:hypothetical protein|nr:DUF1573 domain-containing protein [Bacteroidales bacterium]